MSGGSRLHGHRYRFTHLPVNQAHNGRLHPHPHSEASVHVLMVEEGLEAGQQEHESGIEVAFPQRSILVSHEIQKKTVEEEKCLDLRPFFLLELECT